MILAVSPKVRKAVRENQDYVYIHASRCKVYDHFWVLRCGNCMAYGHRTSHCRLSNPICGYCSGEHKSQNYTQKEQLKCTHCATKDKEDTSHSAFNTKCPYFINAKHNLERKTLTNEDEGTKN